MRQWVLNRIDHFGTVEFAVLLGMGLVAGYEVNALRRTIDQMVEFGPLRFNHAMRLERAT